MGLLPRGQAVLVALLCLVSWANGTDLRSKGTGKTVRFEASLSWEIWAQAGIPRKMILVNGQLPAPTLELRQGDDVEFLVMNMLPMPATIHFHGITQSGTPWSDGTPGLSQRPIRPGGSFLYKWRATNYGSYFYHAHSRGQVDDGLYGAIYIHPDGIVERPFALITDNKDDLRAMRAAEDKTTPLLLSDWRQLTSEEVWAAEEAAGLDSYCVNALLINGKGSVRCLGQKVLDQYTTPLQRQVLGNNTHLTDIGCVPPTRELMEGNFPHNFSAVRPSMFSGCTPSSSVHAQFLVDPDSSYASYNLISAAGTSTLVFSIDEHPMYVYAVDGRYVEPIRVDAVTISNGIRYSVLIQLNQPVGDYTIRLATTGANQILNTTATLSYNTTDKTLKRPSLPSIDITGTLISSNYTALDESTIVPFPVELPPQDVAQTRVLNIDRFNASYRWTLGNTSLPLAAEDRAPLLFYPETTQTSLSIATLNGTWVDLILLVQPFQPPHPIHKHSNKFFVIGQGEGQWNYSSVAEAMQHIPQSFNLKTPQIRDTYYTPAAVTAPSWLAIRYHVVNPGAFLLHCHIQVHLSGGMGLPLLDGVDEWPELPEEYWLAEGV